MSSHEYIKAITKTIKPEMRYDFNEDFSLWQEKSRKKLSELLGLPLKKAQEDNFKITERYIRDEMEFIRFEFQSEDDCKVFCCLVKPSERREKLPMVICLQGHSKGMHISLGEQRYDGDLKSIAGGRDFAIRAAKEGMLAIAIEQRYMGTNGSNNGEPSCVPNNNFTHSNEAMASLLIGRCAIGERVWDVKCTIDIAEKYFNNMIDFSKIICLGNSGGGTVTFYSACIDERIGLAVPSCSVCTYEDSIMSMNHCPCNFIPNIRKYFDMSDLCGLVLPRKMIIVCGKDDGIFPLHGVRRTYEEARRMFEHVKKEKNLRLIIGGEGHRFYPDETWPVIHMLTDDDYMNT